jgi:integral membrane sensor domain MASE1
MTTISLFESKTFSTAQLIAMNVALALIIFLNAKLGSYFSIQGVNLPLAVSGVWPATGFSLAAILLFGFEMWPGILLGNFFYNYIASSLVGHSHTFLMIMAFTIAIGSTFQSLMGGYILRQFSSKGYFNTLLDVFIFLLPAGLITCMIASTIGTTALFFYSNDMNFSFFLTWMTFWLGDSLGVYIFTPLLVVWLTKQIPSNWRTSHLVEAMFMIATLILLTELTYVKKLPVFHLIIPLAIWATYRFHMFGATAAIFLISLAAVIPQSMGFGPYNDMGGADPLLILVSFLEITVTTSLILGAALNEREAGRRLIESENVNLQSAVNSQEEELKDLSSEVFITGKLASIGLNTLDIAKKIREPFYRIIELTQGCLESVGKIEGLIGSQIAKIGENEATVIQNHLGALNHHLRSIADYEAEANWIVDYIHEQSTKTSSENIKISTVNLHALLDLSLSRAMSVKKMHFPSFSFNIVKKFDKNVKVLSTLPEDLSHALVQIFNIAIDSMKQKKDQLLDSYSPVLEVSTLSRLDAIEIIIRDNGLGLEEFLNNVTLKEPEKALALGIQLSHEVFVRVHHGEIILDALKGEYFQITLRIPKSRLQH